MVDPHVVEDTPGIPAVRRVQLCPAELERADAVVLVTDHEAFDYDLVVRHSRYILDTRHRLEGSHVEHL